MTEKWMVDDAGTLINKETRNTYDYVSEICSVLNNQDERIKELQQLVEDMSDYIEKLGGWED